MTPPTVRLRPAEPRDEESVLALAARLAEFGPVGDRTASEIVGAERAALGAAFAHLPDGAALLVADAGDGAVVGFVFVETRVDYFTGAPHGHVGILAVAAEAEGLGVGRALLGAAEAWAAECGFTHLTLTVFEPNVRARRVYERFGFAPELITYRKRLTERTPRRHPGETYGGDDAPRGGVHAR